MSSFIQIFSSDEGEDDGDDGHGDGLERPKRPPWFGPPEEELGAVVPLALVVGRSERGVVAASQATVYSTGVTFDVLALARNLTDGQASRMFHEQHVFEDDDEPPAAFLRLGLELPNGERVSNLGGRRPHRAFMNPEQAPDGAVLLPHGGGGGSSSGGRVAMRPGFWLWPLPQPGTIRVFCEWPFVDIPLSTAEIDGATIAGAADRAVRLWPPG